MNKNYFLPGLLFFSFLVYGQPTTPTDWGLRRFTVNSKETGSIGFYMDTVNLKRKAPLLLYINGSGGYPLCFYVIRKSGSEVITTFETHVLQKTRKEYHVVLIDKPGFDFCDTLRTDEKDISKLLEHYTPPEYYTNTLSLEWRVAAVQKVITYLMKNRYTDNNKIVVWGFSEGGQVAPKVARVDKRVSHVVSMMGSGLNQFYDNIVAARVKVEKQELTQEQGQVEVDKLLKQYKDIYKNPTATNKTFWGHTYKRWASFCAESGVETLLSLNIPIYMVAGSADANSPIYGLDYVPLEFLRKGKTNLTYDVCVGCDHYQRVIASENENRKGESRSDEYIEKIMTWINTH